MSIEQQLTRLTTARNNIRTALNNKGVAASEHGFEDFASDITAIAQEQDIAVEPLTVTENGTYTPETGKAFGPVTVESYKDVLDYTYGTIQIGSSSKTDMSEPADRDFLFDLSDFKHIYGISSIFGWSQKSLARGFSIKWNTSGVTLLNFARQPQHPFKWVKTINLLSSTKNIRTFGRFLYACYGLETINGDIDFTSATNVDSFATTSGNSEVQNLSFVSNTLRLSISFSTCNQLTNASILSLANCLVIGSQTLTLHSTIKDLCDSTYVTYSQVTDDTGTYDFATLAEATDEGAITLMNFITQVKGWTVA